MHRSRLAILLVPATAAFVLAAAPNARKDPYGVYGVIDSVLFEPSQEKAERIRVWGVFALADNIGIANGEIAEIQVGRFRPPQRGYLYYTVNRRDETVTRAEWAAMKGLAGTRQPVAFGAPFPPEDSTGKPATFDLAFARRVMAYNGRLQRDGEPAVEPDTFPLRMPGVSVSMRANAASAAKHNLFSVP